MELAMAIAAVTVTVAATVMAGIVEATEAASIRDLVAGSMAGMPAEVFTERRQVAASMVAADSMAAADDGSFLD
jgi:phosphoribosylaminoimidazole (AIR) synthetase